MSWAVGILGICLVWYAGYICWNFYGFSKLKVKEDLQEKDLPSITILVPARNESLFVRQCLDACERQNYHQDLEIILIDDHSEDNTRAIADEMARSNSRMRVLSLTGNPGVAYKKAALALGIAEAKGEIILTTDADCTMGPNWAHTMASHFTPETGLVSGPVQLSHGDDWLEKFQALEFMGLVAVGAASMEAGRPNLANGANLAFRKEAFTAVGGYAGIDSIASGDDELLMQKIISQTDWKAKFAFNREAIVTTPAQSSWTALKAQRVRWVSKSRHYKNKFMTLQLSMSWLAMWFFPVCLVAAVFDWRYLLTFIAGFSLKTLADGLILRRASIFFQNQYLLKYLLPEELLHVFYLIWAGIAGNMGSYKWKGRRVN